MAFRNFRYSFLHAARDAGVSALSSNNGVVSGYPLDNLIDSMAGYICRLDTVAADHYLQLNRGAAGLEEIDRLYIPVGHNLNTETVRVRTDTTTAFSPGTEILAETAISSAAAIDLPMTGGNETQRKAQYVRLDFPNAGSIQPELPELVYSRIRAPSVGPEKGWTDMLIHNTQDFMKRTGVVASLSRGADRRLFELVYRDVDLPADLAIFSELITTCGTSLPFLVDPMFDTEAVVWMKQVDDSRQGQDQAVPATTETPMKQVHLNMLQHLA